jgi:hypothetical protein
MMQLQLWGRVVTDNVRTTKMLAGRVIICCKSRRAFSKLILK